VAENAWPSNRLQSKDRAMNNADRPTECFSANVQMELGLHGSSLRISHFGRDFLIVTDPIEHPPAS
jgi:hypothetical protein